MWPCRQFGQNFAGVTQIKVKGLPAGTRLLVRHAELLSPCGDVLPQQCPVAQPTAGDSFEGGWPCSPSGVVNGPKVSRHDIAAIWVAFLSGWQRYRW